MDEEEVDQPEVDNESDPKVVIDAFKRINALVNEYDAETTEWAHELRDELRDPIKQNLLNRINVYDDDSEFFGVLGSIDHAPDRSEEFNFRQELLNPNKLENELIALLSHVESARVQTSKRLEKLHSGFARVNDVQKSVTDKIIKKVRNEAGLTKLEEREQELKEQVASLQNSLQEKKETIQRNNREKQLSTEELRKKYEQDVEERIRTTILTIEQKTKDLNVIIAANEKLKTNQANLQNDLGKLLYDLEQEERTAAAEAPVAMNPLHRFRASVYRHANAKGASTNLFADLASGTITQELVGDSNKALDEAFAKQQELYIQITETEERIVALRKELTTLLQSEENKALDRLKKVCDNLQVKIQSDEQRVKVMAALVNQMQRGEAVVASQRATVRKTVFALAANRDKPAMTGNVRARVRVKTPTTPKEREGLTTFEELLTYAGGVGDTSRESISMRLHRRLYAQYYTAAGAAAVGAGTGTGSETGRQAEEGGSGSDSERPSTVRTIASEKSVRPQDLPRKRRITAAQSVKVQKILDMINLQYTRLSSVHDEDMRQILDYREFAGEAERPESTLSNYSSTGASAVGSIKAGVSSQAGPVAVVVDHTKLIPASASAGAAASLVEPSAVSPRAASPRQSSPGGRARSAGGGPRAALTDAHLRVPTTADLEDQNEAEFYVQNYGTKLALEHLNAFLEVLTSGRSTNAGFSDFGTGSDKQSAQGLGSDEQELQSVEGLRTSIQRLISLIRELHYLSQNNKAVRKALQSEVDAKLRECDRLRSELLQEIEGAHWPITTKAGQYEMEIEQCSLRVRELKKLVKQWDQRVNLKRAQNIRLSAVVSQASTRRATAVKPKLSAIEEFQKRRREKGKAAIAEAGVDAPTASAPPPSAAAPPTALDVAGREIEERYSVANRRMSLFEDISSIYSEAMSNIRKADQFKEYANPGADVGGDSVVMEEGSGSGRANTLPSTV